eukprot:GEMP01035346.1.p1 GENE.GEMP01035346.1~~GEMP01035346.1.p1  ORF type:complete len:373 (+),score=72.60 GEMP01035346.1:125-1243(+)
MCWLFAMWNFLGGYAAFVDKMLLYDSTRTEFVDRAVSAFVPLLREDSIVARHNVVRSVDIMSYTIGIGNYLREQEFDLMDTKENHESEIIKLLPGPHVCDIGSGYGGFARELSLFHGLKVTAIEFRKDVSVLAERFQKLVAKENNSFELTFWDDPRANVNDGLRFLAGGGCNSVVAFLAFLHTPKEDLVRVLSAGLKPGGVVYAEELVVLDAVKTDSRFARKVKDAISMFDLTTHSEYEALLKKHFQPLRSSLIYDVTPTWKKFVLARWKAFTKLTDSTPFCLRDEKVVPMPAMTDLALEENCIRLRELMPNSQTYLATQGGFFCVVCELLNGRSEDNQPCECPTADFGDFAHPPIVGGAYIAGRRAAHDEL